MLKRLHAYEQARNQRDWQALDIPTLGANGLLLPATFRMGESSKDAMVLRELAKANVSLATAPLPLGAEALAYVQQQLQPRSVDSYSFDKDKSPRRFGWGSHTYKAHDLSLWNVYDKAESPAHFADLCIKTLNETLPPHELRADFARDFGRGLLNLAEALGVPGDLSFSASDGWMPSPHKLQPHHDFGQHCVRVFFNICGAGTLVVAPESLPLEQQRMIQKGDSFATAYPSFNKLAQQQVPIYSLPMATISAWRVGMDMNWRHDQMSSLPHAFPPHQGGMRLTAYADYRYHTLEKHTGMSWQKLTA